MDVERRPVQVSGFPKKEWRAVGRDFPRDDKPEEEEAVLYEWGEWQEDRAKAVMEAEWMRASADPGYDEVFLERRITVTTSPVREDLVPKEGEEAVRVRVRSIHSSMVDPETDAWDGLAESDPMRKDNRRLSVRLAGRGHPPAWGAWLNLVIRETPNSEVAGVIRVDPQHGDMTVLEAAWEAPA